MVLLGSSGDYCELQTASNLTCWNFKLFRTQICSPFQTPPKTPNFKPPNTSWFGFKFGHFVGVWKSSKFSFGEGIRVWRCLTFNLQNSKQFEIPYMYLGSTQHYKIWKQQFYTIQYLLLLLTTYSVYILYSGQQPLLWVAKIVSSFVQKNALVMNWLEKSP